MPYPFMMSNQINCSIYTSILGIIAGLITLNFLLLTIIIVLLKDEISFKLCNCSNNENEVSHGQFCE